jgi:hypothetical protein
MKLVKRNEYPDAKINLTFTGISFKRKPRPAPLKPKIVGLKYFEFGLGGVIDWEQYAFTYNGIKGVHRFSIILAFCYWGISLRINKLNYYVDETN